MEDKIFENIFFTERGIISPEITADKGYVILYPTEGYYISKKQYKRLMKVLKKKMLVNDVVCVDIEGVKKVTDLQQSTKRSIRLFDYKEYMKETLLLENSILDIQFKWSISIYQDYWGILYGDIEIIKEFSKIYDLGQDLENFKKDFLSEAMNKNFQKQLEGLVKNTYKYAKNEK